MHEFVRLAEQHGLPRIATVQNAYCLVSRGVDNGLDETMHRLGVSLLAYSPLGFGLLTGKYDESGFEGPMRRKDARIAQVRVACASSAGAAPRRWPPRAATTRWRATTA